MHVTSSAIENQNQRGGCHSVIRTFCTRGNRKAIEILNITSHTLEKKTHRFSL